MLESLITSKTRIKLLVKFFVNAKNTAYLRNLETEFGESTNAIRIELNRFVDVGLLNFQKIGNRKYYKANINHPYFNNIHQLLLKHVGIDTIIENIIIKTGNLEKAFVTGEIANGNQGNIIDITLVGKNLDYNKLNRLIVKTEKLVSSKIRYIVVSNLEMVKHLADSKSYLMIWSANY